MTLRIDREHLALNSHFFTRKEIEFDLDPHDFQNDQQVSRLLDFIRVIGRLLNKPVILTPERMIIHFLCSALIQKRMRRPGPWRELIINNGGGQ